MSTREWSDRGGQAAESQKRVIVGVLYPTGDAPRERLFRDVFWSEAETCKVENTGTANSGVLIVELKIPGKPKG